MITALLALAAISPVPAPGTPSLIPHRGPATAEIRQLAKCGGAMYAAGQFTVLRSHGKNYPRRGAFSFSARPPYRMTSWNPRPGQSGAITLNSGCTRAWVGTRTGIAEYAIPSGRKIRFTRTGGQVNALLLWHGHLLAGGRLPGSPLYSLDPRTGRHDGFMDGLDIRGSEPPAPPGPSKIWNFQLSPNGKRLLAEGNFTSVAGKGRRQIFMLNLDVSHGPATLTPWYSTMFNGQCIPHEAFYVRDAAWSPDGKTIYTASTGDHEWPKMTIPHTGLCDSVAAFPDRWENVPVTWRNYFGCDSAYSVGTAGGLIFAAGHQRWVQNRRGCDKAGPGAIPYPGLAAFTPQGAPVLTASGKARYSMSRANAGDMLTTGAGLWIAATNRFNANMCGGRPGHSGLCFLPGG
jgi:hypothetical protein